MPARAKAESPDTYRSMPRRTKANGVADEQLNRADILALNMLLPAVLSRVGRLLLFNREFRTLSIRSSI